MDVNQMEVMQDEELDSVQGGSALLCGAGLFLAVGGVVTADPAVAAWGVFVAAGAC